MHDPIEFNQKIFKPSFSFPQPPPVDEGEELYTEAMALLNSSAPGNRKKAWDMMDEAAALGHVGARVRIAWAKFAGWT